jgi:hypothetical protein
VQQPQIVATQGSRAARQGRNLETLILPIFQNKNFEVVSYSAWSKKKESYGDKLLLKHVPYTTIYGHPGYTEFLVRSLPHKLNVRIECKWQQSSGSVDEKLPYLYLNCIEAMPETDIIIIAGGGGMKQGAIPWLKTTVLTKKYLLNSVLNKNIQVFTIDEFLRWANTTIN